MKHKTTYSLWVDVKDVNDFTIGGHWVQVTRKEFEKFLLSIQKDYNRPFIRDERDEFMEHQIRIRLEDETWFALISTKEVY